MSERQKLDLGGITPVRERPDPETILQLSEEHGFPSRDARPRTLRKPADEPSTENAVSAPSPAPRTPKPSDIVSPNPSEFRRPGRPASDRLIAINVRVSTETADAIYRIRESKPRQTIADVLETLVAFYEENGGAERG